MRSVNHLVTLKECLDTLMSFMQQSFIGNMNSPVSWECPCLWALVITLCKSWMCEEGYELGKGTVDALLMEYAHEKEPNSWHMNKWNIRDK